jgi:hypothetical protein
MANSSILARIKSEWQRFLQDRRSALELATIPPSELRRIAREVGLSEGNLEALSHNHPGPTELMPQRLQELGLDPEFIRHAQPATYRDMEKTCGTCSAWRRCARDLANGDVQTGMGTYCVNASTIDALTVDGPLLSRAKP